MSREQDIRPGVGAPRADGVKADAKKATAMKAAAQAKVPEEPVGWHLPIQQEIYDLHKELAAFNERIKELEKEGHRGHAMEVLKKQALRMAGQIDELRYLMAAPKQPGRLDIKYDPKRSTKRQG